MVKKHTLEQTIIDRFEHAQINRNVVTALFDEIKSLNLQDFFDCALFSVEKPYGRKLLFYSPDVEVLIMGFLPERECPPHDHGKADGLVLVCYGEARHKVFTRHHNSLQLVLDTRELQGYILDAPIDCVHGMGNSSTHKPLITLHVYWPPIEQMSVFDLDQKRIYIVNDKAGAWLPIAPETLLETHELK